MLELRRVVRAFEFDSKDNTGFIGLPDGTDCGFEGQPVLATIRHGKKAMKAGEFCITCTGQGKTLRVGLGNRVEIHFVGVTILPSRDASS